MLLCCMCSSLAMGKKGPSYNSISGRTVIASVNTVASPRLLTLALNLPSHCLPACLDGGDLYAISGVYCSNYFRVYGNFSGTPRIAFLGRGRVAVELVPGNAIVAGLRVPRNGVVFEWPLSSFPGMRMLPLSSFPGMRSSLGFGFLGMWIVWQ